MNIIKLDKQAVIEYSALDKIAEQVDTRLATYNFDQLVIDDESIKGIKKLRATLRKEYEEFEESRKSIKRLVNEPYEKFEKEYKSKIASKYEDADKKLKDGIDDVEGQIKRAKEVALVQYFDKQVKAKEIDFVKFIDVGLKVNLSNSITLLKKEIDEFLERVDKDVEAIAIQKHSSRILVEYKKHLNLNEAIATVLRAIEAEEALEAKKQAQIEQAEAPKAPPTPQMKPTVSETPQKMITLTFKVTATKEALIELREYMKERGIKYE